MTAKPVIDPGDPEAILRALPAREREAFRRQYREALASPREVIQRLLHAWSLRAYAVNRPGYYERSEQAQNRDDHPELFIASFDQIVPIGTSGFSARRGIVTVSRYGCGFAGVVRT